MLKSSILIVALLITGCTINGKHLNEMMEKQESKSNLDLLTPDAPKVTKSEKPTSKFHFKWANKEYHDGKEDINLRVK